MHNDESLKRRLSRIVSCVSVVLFSTHLVWGDDFDRPSRFPIFSPQNSKDTGDTQPESYENYQLRILRNQNHLQAEKIKSLREELHEVTQKLHDLKPHLFNKGDPADQVKIAYLTQLLKEKEDSLNQLTSTKERLDQDLSTVIKKLNELEIVKEALAKMVDSQRFEKERDTANFLKQIDEIQFTAEIEKSDLLKKIKTYAATEEKLDQQLRAKTQTIQRLDSLTTKMNNAMAAKNEELLHLEGQILSLYDLLLQASEQHMIAIQGHEKQFEELMTALDLERTQVHQLLKSEEEGQWLFDLYQRTENLLVQEKFKNLELLEENENHIQNLHEGNEDIQQLVFLIELEQMQRKQLENLLRE